MFCVDNEGWSVLEENSRSCQQMNDTRVEERRGIQLEIEEIISGLSRLSISPATTQPKSKNVGTMKGMVFLLQNTRLAQNERTTTKGIYAGKLINKV